MNKKLQSHIFMDFETKIVNFTQKYGFLNSFVFNQLVSQQMPGTP
jgi:hypothetical protein